MVCWNRPGELSDYYRVDCEEYREALSARLDDEEGPEDAGMAPDQHLEHCFDCTRWYDDAALITRRTRTTAVVAWPDVTEAVLARVPPASSRDVKPRVTLAGTGVLLGASALVSLALPGSAQSPAGYENAGWHLALGVAFIAVATRRAAPAALVPLLGTFVAVLSWGHVSDVLSGRWNVAGVLSHLLVVLGLVLVVLLGRMPPPRRGPSPPVAVAGRIRRAPKPGKDAGAGTQAVIRSIAPESRFESRQSYRKRNF